MTNIKMWIDAIFRNWKISGIVLLVLLAVIGSIVWWRPQISNFVNQKRMAKQAAAPVENKMKQEFADRLPDLQKKAQADPNNPAIQQELGVTKYATGDLQGAKEAYEKGIQLDSKNAVLHNNLGNTYRDLGDHAKAETEYRTAMKLNPKLTTPYMNLGSIYQYVFNKPDSALQVYADGIKSNPDYVDFYNATAAIYEQQGLNSKAASYFQQALKIQPGNPAAEAGLKRVGAK